MVRAVIVHKYLQIDEAVGRLDEDAMLAATDAQFIQIGRDGTERTREQVLATARRQFHQPSRKAYAQQWTLFDSIEVDGSKVVSRGRQQVAIGLVDAVGSAVLVKGDSTYEDSWVKAGDDRRLEQNRILTQQIASRAMLSQAMMQIIGQMHRMVEDMPQFMTNVSESNCYWSTGMQQYSADERRARCKL